MTVEDGVDHRARAGRRAARAGSCSRPRSSTRTSTCARPVARTRRRSRPAPPQPRPAATARSSRCRTPTRPSTTPRCSSRCVEHAHEPRRSSRRGSWRRSRRGSRGEELTEMAELAATGAVAFTDDGQPGRVRRADAARARSTARSPTGRSRSTARSRRSRATARCTRARSPPSSGFAGWPSVAESVMVERDLSLAALRGPAGAPHAPVRARVGRRAPRAPSQRVCRASGEATPHHLCAHRRARAHARPEREDEPAARAPRTTGGRSSRRVRDGTIACIATDHAPHALHEKEAPFEEAPFGVTGLETAFARAQHGARPHGRARRSSVVLERMSAGPARVARAAGAADRRRRGREPRPARPRAGSGPCARTRSARARPTRGSSGGRSPAPW